MSIIRRFMRATIALVWFGHISQVRAQTDEIQVYDGAIAPAGVYNLTLHNNDTPSGSNAGRATARRQRCARAVRLGPGSARSHERPRRMREWLRDDALLVQLEDRLEPQRGGIEDGE
jgi:hypothetical protein